MGLRIFLARIALTADAMTKTATRRPTRWSSIMIGGWTILALLSASAIVPAQEPTIFAVVTKVSRDKKQVIAQVSAGGTVSEAVLTPSDAVADNMIWRNLEMCHSLRAEASKTADGYKILSVKMLDAGMLPMSLQGVAGDCLLKKALEFAPLVD
jgi:hypothetical protein